VVRRAEREEASPEGPSERLESATGGPCRSAAGSAVAAIKLALVAVTRTLRRFLLIPAIIMKKVTAFGCIATAVFAAVTARGDYSLSIQTSPEQFTTLGGSGQCYFDVTFSDSTHAQSVWTFRNYQLQGVDSMGLADSSLFSSLTVDPASTLRLGSGQTYLSGNTYRLIVDWTVANNAVPDPAGNGIYFNLFLRQPNSVNANAGATDVLTVSVPEASQVAASALLVLGGTGVYVGGRTIRRKT
jgi:hypothetical protein